MNLIKILRNRSNDNLELVSDTLGNPEITTATGNEWADTLQELGWNFDGYTDNGDEITSSGEVVFAAGEAI